MVVGAMRLRAAESVAEHATKQNITSDRDCDVGSESRAGEPNHGAGLKVSF